MSWKGFGKGLLKGLTIAGGIATSGALDLVPGGAVIRREANHWLPMTGLIQNAVLDAEPKASTGPERLQIALNSLKVAGPFLIPALEEMFGMDLPDEAIEAYMTDQINATVKLFNTKGVLPRQEK